MSRRVALDRQTQLDGILIAQVIVIRCISPGVVTFGDLSAFKLGPGKRGELERKFIRFWFHS